MSAAASAAPAPGTIPLEQRIAAFQQRFAALRAAIGTAIVGQQELIDDCLVAMHIHGHVLLEGVPGLGKTSLVRTLSKVFNLSFGRVQCTPDLMPSDILGTHVVHEDEHGHRSFRFERGPVFRNLLLVDEINRATPKTQAALLEVMQERQVTAGQERMALPSPFFVLATQNPVEMEGTYPLPEAQLDRFAFKLTVRFPGADDLIAIARATTGFSEAAIAEVMGGVELEQAVELCAQVPVAEPLLRYAANLVLASHPDRPEAPAAIRSYASYGASPRALQVLVRAARVQALLAGRAAVTAADLRRVARPALRHRIIRNFEGEAQGIAGDALVEAVLAGVAEPGA